MHVYRFFITLIFVVSTIYSLGAMQNFQVLAQEEFVDQELTALALIENSIQQQSSLNFVINKKIVAIFNYKKQEVIAYFDDEHHYKFSYEQFEAMMKNQLQNNELLQNNSQEKDQHSFAKKYMHGCVCSIS